MIVSTCVALYLSVLGFKPFDVDCIWYLVVRRLKLEYSNRPVAYTVYGTSAHDYGLDAAGESPTVLSVTWL